LSSSKHVAIGPELPEFGSWNWLGIGLRDALQSTYQTSTFTDLRQPPAADVVVFLKFKPPLETLKQLRRQNCRLIFLPVDVYGSASEIDLDIESIGCFDLVIVSSRRHLRYFNSMANVEYVDHPLKYVLPKPRETWTRGPSLWIGRQCNIGPVVDWANQQAELDLWILTESEERELSPKDLGFHNPKNVRVGTWSESKHIDWLAQASVAVDIKGNDFRARHKPPAKAFDYLASGIPVLTNQGASVALEMAERNLKPLYRLPTGRSDSVSADYLARCASAVQLTAKPDFVWQQMTQLVLGNS
jgi:hypothetical protein